LIVALLRNEFIVDVVNDGQDAIEKLKSRQYAAVVLDLLMPVADGYAVLDYLTSENPDVLARVLVVTASISARTLQRVNEYPICKLVAKPFDVEVLQALVRACAGVTPQPAGGAILSGGVLLLLADLLR
jgi:CheY-like chemotaxis protein